MSSSKLAALVAACFAAAAIGTVAGTGNATSPPPPSPPAVAAADWERVVPGGDCACAGGSEFNFWVREADPTKIVLFLEGGGACFDATSCAFVDAPSTLYDWNISADDDPARQDGIFELANEDNPFAGYTFVYVPYCTGDVHLGNIIREYSPEVSVHHVGAVNGLSALAHLAGNYGDAAQVVVVGESAGAIASPVYGGLVSDLLPDAQVTVFADGSGAYPDDPGTSAAIGALWGAFANVPNWEVNEGITPEEWSIPRFWVQAGLHDPEITMARFDYDHDAVQASFIEATGTATADLAATMADNEAMIEAAGVVQYSYTAPGDEHTLVRTDDFYAMQIDDVALVDWVTDLVAGEPVDDVP
jgi:pectinacetylesterase